MRATLELNGLTAGALKLPNQRLRSEDHLRSASKDQKLTFASVLQSGGSEKLGASFIYLSNVGT